MAQQPCQSNPDVPSVSLRPVPNTHMLQQLGQRGIKAETSRLSARVGVSPELVYI